LPDEINSGRVFEPGWANGMARPWAWPWAAVELGPHRRSLFVGHDRELEVDAGDAGQRADGPGHAVLDLVAQWAARDREGDQDLRPAVGADGNRLHHAEIDDRPMQLRVLDRAKCFDDLIRGCDHDDSVSPITTTPIGRIPAWFERYPAHRRRIR
jgi:hypothetical protein